ncbi:uncharacterized protein ACIGJ3_009845 isoform 1-T1 [Trichechus inunguis]
MNVRIPKVGGKEVPENCEVLTGKTRLISQDVPHRKESAELRKCEIGGRVRMDRVNDRDGGDCAEGPTPASRSEGRRSWLGLPCGLGQTPETGGDTGAQSPDCLRGEVSNRRPREGLSRLEVQQPPSPTHSRSGNSSAELSQSRPPRLPRTPDPTNSTSSQGIGRSLEN